MQRSREPIFNLPGALVAAVGALLVFHIIRLMLPQELAAIFIYTFGFVPARYGEVQAYGPIPGGPGAAVWSFFTYALLHGDWIHLGINVAWMVAFGTPVLRRFGGTRFLLLSMAAAAGGALAQLAFHAGEVVPMIGASAAISGQMAAAIRFAFQDPGPLRYLPPGDDRRWQMPALPLVLAFRDVRVLAFVVIWFVVNFAFGAFSTIPGAGATIAWEAHIGGFLVGLLLFPLFDPRREPPVAPMPRDGYGPYGPDVHYGPPEDTEDQSRGSS